jgi:molecular chaperone GrpE
MEEKDMKTQEENGQPLGAEFDLNADSDVPGTSHLNEPVKETGELEKLELEIQEWKDKFIRQAAEYDNFRKRTAKEKVELIQTAGKEVIGSLLEVLDDSERAQKQLGDQPNLEGINLVFTKLRNILQAKGLKSMECIGEEFDPEMHEAITEIPAPTEELKGKVIDVVEKGYYMNNKIIRFAKVVVGK